MAPVSGTFPRLMTDVTDATFETDVVERSKQVPVVIDLWAEWCGPCRMLTPILEKVVAETEGAVELVKVDVDANPAISQAFRVQSIPSVYAMKDGQVVDGFMGAQGEPAVKEFVSRLVPTPEQTEVEMLVAAGDEASLRKALDIESDHPDAVTALAALLIDSDRADEAIELLSRVPETAETRRLAAVARLGEPTDDIDAKLESLLSRAKDDDDARQEFIDLLEVLGADDPRTTEWRRRLSTALF
jgi:putative thioredoxin